MVDDVDLRDVDAEPRQCAATVFGVDDHGIHRVIQAALSARLSQSRLSR